MLCAADAAAQTQRSMTISELFGLVETGSKTLRMQKTGVDVAIRGKKRHEAGGYPTSTLHWRQATTETY